MTIDPNTDLASNAAPREIVFVDSRVRDAETLLKGFPPDAEVIFLEAGEDGLQQMAEVLGARGDVGTVHVVAHGSEGQLWLGTTFLDSSTLADHGDAAAEDQALFLVPVENGLDRVVNGEDETR